MLHDQSVCHTTNKYTTRTISMLHYLSVCHTTYLYATRPISMPHDQSVYHTTYRHATRPIIMFRMEVASSRPDHIPTLSVDKTSELSLLVKSPLVAERSMPALLLRLLLQCSGDIDMNRGPVSTPTPTNCLRLME